MNKLKFPLLLLTAFIAGVVLTVLILRPVINEYQLADRLTIKLHQIQDFTLLNKQSEEFAYCFRYESALNNVESVKESLDNIKYDDATVILKMTVDWAENEIESFGKIKKQNLKYACKKHNKAIKKDV